MFQRFVDAANANPGVCGLVLCGIMLVAVLILTLDRRHEKRMKERIRQLEEAVETKERLIVHKDAEIKKLKAEIKKLKTELFAARCDKKFSDEKLNRRIAQLETDKKQLTKWGAEK